jgi:mono/diheme cytochrome c family protein
MHLWVMAHGAATHFPIALLVGSLTLDLAARFVPETRGLTTAGYWTVLGAALGAVGAVMSGLAASSGEMLGHDVLRLHHLFVWPAFVLLCVIAAWRILRPVPGTAYLGVATLATASMMGAGYWGGELLQASEQPALAAIVEPAPIADPELAAQGRAFFMATCARCHGVDATGDEGPDLHGLQMSDRYISRTITRGIRGEMPSFAKKYDARQVAALVAYLRTLIP